MVGEEPEHQSESWLEVIEEDPEKRVVVEVELEKMEEVGAALSLEVEEEPRK